MKKEEVEVTTNDDVFRTTTDRESDGGVAAMEGGDSPATDYEDEIWWCGVEDAG